MHTFNDDWTYEELISDLNKSETNKLSIILSRLELGNDKVLITPVGERVGPEVIFAEWNKIFMRNSNKMNEVLIEIELNQKEKFGPRSVAAPWSEIKANTLSTFDVDDHNCDHLSAIPYKSSDKGILRPMSLLNVSENIKKNTNAGLPTLSKKCNVLLATLDNLRDEYEANYPMVPFIRTQEQGKTRVIMGYPFSDIIMETLYFEPLFNYFRKFDQFAAMRGPEDVNTAMTRLLFETVRLGQKCVSGDISGFDKDFGPSLQDNTFRKMSYLIQERYIADFQVIAHRFGNKGLVTPEGVINGQHGLPSGSRGTNLVGSVGNDSVNGQPLRQILGDDFACASDDPNELFDRYERCGMELNKDKTKISDGYYLYLQMLFHPDYQRNGEIVGVYPTWRALNRLIYPERFSEFNTFDLDGKSYFAIRSLSILENCKYHPLFEELIKFWLRFEKYALPTNNGIRKYAQYLKATTGSTGTTNQYGDDVRGMTNFHSYKLIAKLI